MDTSAPRKLRHCKDDANSTPTSLQELQTAVSSTPTTSKNSINSITNITASDTHTTPKVLILLLCKNNNIKDLT